MTGLAPSMRRNVPRTARPDRCGAACSKELCRSNNRIEEQIRADPEGYQERPDRRPAATSAFLLYVSTVRGHLSGR